MNFYMGEEKWWYGTDLKKVPNSFFIHSNFI